MIKMTMAQKLVGLFFLWVIISGVFIARIELNSFVYVRWFALALLYLAASLFRPKTLILYTIIFGGSVQAIIAIGQQLAYIESGHSQFSITGLLDNPGPLGGCQAVALIIALALAKESANKYSRLILLLSSLLIAYTVILSDSRASWMATLFGIIAILYEPITSFIKNHRKWAVPLLSAVVVSLSIVAFNYRSDSARSRLLIWRVSADMIGDHPVLGHGLSSFNKHYMLYQAAFFEKNSHSSLARVADNAAYPYNEFLHVWIELGIVGLLILVAALALTFYSAEKKIRAPLVALLVFSLFSYPSSINVLMMMFQLLVGLSLPRKKCSYANAVASCLFLIVLLLWFLERGFIREANKNLQKTLLTVDKQAELYIEQNRYHIAEYPALNTLYSLALIKQADEIDNEKINLLLPTCENWCDIGNIYVSQSSFGAAEKYYKEASLMIPTRFTPKYLLFKMYQETNRINEAMKIANEILEMPLKVENTYTLKHKAEIRAFLEAHT